MDFYLTTSASTLPCFQITWYGFDQDHTEISPKLTERVNFMNDMFEMQRRLMLDGYRDLEICCNKLFFY